MNNYLPSGSGLSAPGCPSKADVAAQLTMRNVFSIEQAVSLSTVCLLAGGTQTVTILIVLTPFESPLLHCHPTFSILLVLLD